MVLYEFGPTRSLRARWVLQELQVPFESVVVDLRAGEHRKPAFLQLNAAGKLPVLADGDFVLTESVAIVLYLAAKYPDACLLPSDPQERAQVHRWLLFAATELEQPLWRVAKHTSLYPQAARLPADIELARNDFLPMASVLERHMDRRDFVVGSRVSVADFVLAYTLDWANELKWLSGCPGLVAYMERMYRRPHAAPRIAQARASIGR
ncbi:MAG TPA: glutathione S-transferase family protein [Ramlibacter sp.]|nr:glutathione S-transferase family protein [Ramlibacter sp.]